MMFLRKAFMSVTVAAVIAVTATAPASAMTTEHNAVASYSVSKLATGSHQSVLNTSSLHNAVASYAVSTGSHQSVLIKTSFACEPMDGPMILPAETAPYRGMPSVAHLIGGAWSQIKIWFHRR